MGGFARCKRSGQALKSIQILQVNVISNLPGIALCVVKAVKITMDSGGVSLLIFFLNGQGSVCVLKSGN